MPRRVLYHNFRIEKNIVKYIRTIVTLRLDSHEFLRVAAILYYIQRNLILECLHSNEIPIND